MPQAGGGLMRLNRYLALCGLGSRRATEELIREGQVTLNGQTVSELATQVNPSLDRVLVRGKLVEPAQWVYVLLNKPKNTLSTVRDPDGRPTVMDIIQQAAPERIYPVGRLDRNTTGLLLLTNDGELAERLAHPRNQVRKVYLVRLNRPMEEDELLRLRQGVVLEDGPAKPDQAYVAEGSPPTELVVEMHSGRNRIVRRMIEALGHTVASLDRIAYGPLTKKGLPRGKWRHLTPREVGYLKMMHRPQA